MQILLKLVNGEEMLETIESDSFIIGRSSKADIVVPHEGMSRQHCQIEVVNGDIFVTDLGSTNGVLIDGHKIEPHKKIHYQTYLSLSFGAVSSLQIQTEDSTKPNIVNPLAKSGQNNTRTITRSMQETLKKETQDSTKTQPAKPKAVNKEEKMKSIVVNILALLILAAAVYWYMQKEDSESGDMDYQGPTQETSTPGDDRF